MAIPSNHPEMLVQAHRNGLTNFENYNYNGPSVINPDQPLSIDEPPPPYANNSLPVSPLSDVDVFSQSVLLRPDRRLSGGPVTQSPLTPVPLRHSSLYHVVKPEESPASPTQGTLQSRESSIAHALELQEPQPRHVHPSCTPILGNARARGSTIGASESALSIGKITTRRVLTVVAANLYPPFALRSYPSDIYSTPPPCFIRNAPL
jgi:hypothetical protein